MKSKIVSTKIDVNNEVTINTKNMSKWELRLFYITMKIFASAMKGDLNMTIPDRQISIAKEIDIESQRRH